MLSHRLAGLRRPGCCRHVSPPAALLGELLISNNSGVFFFIGGPCLIISGALEFFLGNTFPFAVFVTYGKTTPFAVVGVGDLLISCRMRLPRTRRYLDTILQLCRRVLIDRKLR